MRKNIICGMFLLLGGVLFAQTPLQKDKIAQAYDQEKINSLKESFELQAIEQERLIDSISKATGQPKLIYKEDGTFIQAVGVFNGQIRYYAMDNKNAAHSTRTDYLYPGGALGLSLDGDGMDIGVWDGGVARANHQEFTDGVFNFRITNGDGTNWTSNSHHATHVAGTIGAYGVDPDAKGMAPMANIITYDWTNDTQEVLAAAQNGLLISNHSYGTRIKSDQGNMLVPEWMPGKYTGFARDWDVIAYNMPYYLAVFSAGNEGDITYPGALAPGYDKLTHEKNSKNNLVVANAQDASINGAGNLNGVVINSSSSQGPTDDLRVKPDIAGNGTQVYSSVATNPTSYNNLSGTSMSSPNVAGTLLLLQQHYNNTHGSFMRSATLKGLACHTADDAGNIGPDVVFGWGLLNAKKAAETITADLQPNSSKTGLIQELSLAQGGTYTINVTASGLEDLKASITWTDVPGNANNSENENDLPLINDLDIIISKGTETFQPWMLSPLNAVGNAVKGNNTVDNVERVDVSNASGNYTITISHKGNLVNGPQDYSLVITGIQGVLGNKDLDLNNNLSIWPNPVKESINFALDGKTFADMSINIYDLNGRVVKSFEPGSENIFSANISELAPGLYIVEISNGASTYREKIIKE